LLASKKPLAWARNAFALGSSQFVTSKANLSFEQLSPKRKLNQRKGAKKQGQEPKKFAPDWARANFFLKQNKTSQFKN